MMLAVVLTALPVSAIETTRLPETTDVSTNSAFVTGRDAGFAPAKHHIDAISTGRSDPITLRFAAVGALVLVTAILARRRRRRRAAWGYVPPEALPQRMLALLH